MIQNLQQEKQVKTHSLLNKHMLILLAALGCSWSNNTKTKDMNIFNAENYAVLYLLRYQRAWHGRHNEWIGLTWGYKSIRGNILVFSDYCRPSIRLSTLINYL